MLEAPDFELSGHGRSIGRRPRESARARSSACHHPTESQSLPRPDNPGAVRKARQLRRPRPGDPAVRVQCRPESCPPTLTRRSTSVNAKLSVWPSFQPSRANAPVSPSSASGCSMLMPKPYLWRPSRSSATMSGTVPCGSGDLQGIAINTHPRRVPIGEQAHDRADRPAATASAPDCRPARVRAHPPAPGRWPSRASGSAPYFKDQCRTDISEYRAVGIAARVGRVIPGAVVPQGPVHELGAGRAGVAVVIEIVAGRQQRRI